MITRHFCTLFDSGYLFKGVAMLESLALHCLGARTYVLCMEDQARSLLERMALPGVTCISLHEVETPDLLEAKKDRSVSEYCWTLSACLVAYVMARWPGIPQITYVDADLLFYSPVEPLFDEIGDASIAIIEHRFTPRLQHLEVNGRFCVEWVSFRRDAEGMACLARWREQCVEWCYYRLEDGKMGDQKYLDAWPADYPSTHILQHLGAGVAPWNFDQYRFTTAPDGRHLVNGAPLVFYHFHQFQLLDNGRFSRLSNYYTAERKEPEGVYADYEAELKRVVARAQAIEPGFVRGLKPAAQIASRRWIQNFLPKPVKAFMRRIFPV